MHTLRNIKEDCKEIVNRILRIITCIQVAAYQFLFCEFQDKSKCACQQMTVDSTAVAGGRINPEAGYSHRRLQEPIRTG